MLADNPNLGAMWFDGSRGLRSFTVSPYILFYRPVPDGIRLVRVLHGARDTGTVLRDV
ncbi:type II toxin-antitoxin system RelE/ParE family toxin [Sphingomonadaceae bacterium OTU29MARTA1]|nr:type II toxin-antitoxin system RelE/ParE family toxin [Sphingomonadaceae bacterium OTU29LAMAA1]USU10375.1 type II toxin-antitoxin system RelE/ParE family toxin [Sphingomonadaceae bacterium OTU29MARTA1]USU10759.1 type II toxin-antitoxin system RelE/ParE family toxin [Sphingomonadaceae bacterium OTU29THOMA1]